MPDFANTLPETVKAAIDVLVAAGFRAFTEAKLEDVRELDTGRRMRTFRNQGRYDLVLAARRIDHLACAGTIEDRPDDAAPGEPIGGGPDNLALMAAEPPLEGMNVAELRAEARKYPRIKGEYKMLKEDLRAAIEEERRIRRLLFKKF